MENKEFIEKVLNKYKSRLEMEMQERSKKDSMIYNTMVNEYSHVNDALRILKNVRVQHVDSLTKKKNLLLLIKA